MKKIYQAPTSKVRKVRPAAIICGSPGSGYSTQSLQEENNVIFNTKEQGHSIWDNEW